MQETSLPKLGLTPKPQEVVKLNAQNSNSVNNTLDSLADPNAGKIDPMQESMGGMSNNGIQQPSGMGQYQSSGLAQNMAIGNTATLPPELAGQASVQTPQLFAKQPQQQQIQRQQAATGNNTMKETFQKPSVGLAASLGGL